MVMAVVVFHSGLPRSELVIVSEEPEVPVQGKLSRKAQRTATSDKPLLTASVTTAKTTLGHSATVKARDLAYQVCTEVFHLKAWQLTIPER